ncbi:MAG: toxin-antitoxin system HicB family antitoxin [Pseudomonadota bacterium]
MARATSAAPHGDRDPEDAPRHSGRLLLRMPPELHGELAERAERDGVSLNQLITRLLAAGVRTPSARERPSRGLRIALAVNLVLVAILAAAALVLVVVALRG